jgi:hypothetical protein
MRIAMDISQVAYERTGVSKSVTKLVENLLKEDAKNEYIFFFSSLRGSLSKEFLQKLSGGTNVKLRTYKIPQSLLTLFWNELHILPIEWLVGQVDVFVTSDWTEPPTKKAKKVTFVHDLTPFLFTNETDEKIIRNHKLKLSWAKKECEAFICPSESTKKDLEKLFNVKPEKVHVVRWGVGA